MKCGRILQIRSGCSVRESSERSVMSVWWRIGLWFVCLLLAIAFFSLL